jgi:hypothetical protein
MWDVSSQKKRGKRTATEVVEGPSKKRKTEGEDNSYLREVKKFSERTLRDEGAGVRPLGM